MHGSFWGEILKMCIRDRTFEGMDTYPIKDQENWTPGIVGADDIPEGFSLFATDNVPTCRLLNCLLYTSRCV